jgi:hypothetical protein
MRRTCSYSTSEWSSSTFMGKVKKPHMTLEQVELKLIWIIAWIINGHVGLLWESIYEFKQYNII